MTPEEYRRFMVGLTAILKAAGVDDETLQKVWLYGSENLPNDPNA